ncbi:SCO1664 family protein [Raineyella sp. LH-20]|uniref:SCO1664 family protein n=1 Tax=Raineyella sp. LH-20 TaxID=3081204 RepID=UPI002954F37F|nr:SCO1664 family protein [Raineyella sp. LH-20]WOP18387.1 SCO1664 family protein [Raineyella sp. LH-20]
MHPALATTLFDRPTPTLRVLGRIRTASNATYLAEVDAVGVGEAPVRCVWKPVAGERPLWDFPDGTLAAREAAAYALSAAAGFDVVPTTRLVRSSAGEGAVQTWVEIDEDLEDLVGLAPADRIPPGWLGVVDAVDAYGRDVTLVHRDDPRLRRLALFDAVSNNADRKRVHLLPSQGSVLGCDHGLCFHVEPKLRTVLWGWAGACLDREETALLERTRTVAGEVLDGLLTGAEIAAVVVRAEALLAAGALPGPQDTWPSIPWPPL